MRSEQEIKERITELEEMWDDCYLDEGQQSELQTLYWVLGEEC